jgi:hypothetical protein
MIDPEIWEATYFQKYDHQRILATFPLLSWWYEMLLYPAGISSPAPQFPEEKYNAHSTVGNVWLLTLHIQLFWLLIYPLTDN